MSVIIPVRDDATRLAACLRSLQTSAGAVPFDLIVADNGSSDGSDRVAAAAGARVLSLPGLRVAAMRNVAAREAATDLLAFVDADHEVGPQWISSVIDLFADPAVTAAGAQYSTPTQASWVQRAYDALRLHASGTRVVDWLPSGNLAIRRAMFEQIGGFDERLETCEDVDLCQRLTAAGGRLMASDRLRSTHHGDPRTLSALFRGELWRGRDSLRVSLRAPRSLRSILSVGLALIPVLCLAGVALGVVSWPWGGWRVAAASLLLFGGLSGARALRAWRTLPPGGIGLARLLAAVVVYDFARALALISRMDHRVRRTG